MIIYIGNIVYTMTADDLRGVFAPYGAVSEVKIITDKISGKSKGYGFVEMEDEEEAKKAIAELNNSTVKGRNIKVNNAFRKSEMPIEPKKSDN